MDYRQAREFMAGTISGIHLELDRIRALLDDLDHPEERLRIIHIAGTNGKGSIAAFLSSALQEAGLQVGMYTSPVVFHYGEQFRINGAAISDTVYIRYAEKISEATERMKKKGKILPSAFELETALAFLYFQEMDCDWAVIECGMGGRDDATNIIPAPEIAVLSSISMDHMTYLGKTLKEITAVKAGIIKPGCVAVCTKQRPEAEKVIRKTCDMLQVPLVISDIDKAEILSDTISGLDILYKGVRIRTGICGLYQAQNVITAYDTLKILQSKKVDITDDQILEGIRKTRWNGRFTILSQDPAVIVDGAHNPDAVQKMILSLKKYFPEKKYIFIMGIFADKDYKKVIKSTVPLAEYVYAIETPGNPRALPADKLAEEISGITRNTEACHTIQEALEKAWKRADKDSVILSFGSLSNIQEFQTELKKIIGKKINE